MTIGLEVELDDLHILFDRLPAFRLPVTVVEVDLHLL
jgi:hypothetical protein